MKIGSHAPHLSTTHSNKGVVPCTYSDCLSKGITDLNAQKESGNDSSLSKANTDFSSSQRQQLVQLQQRDSEVRAHEAAHIAAGGSVVSGGASFTYQEGPDGKLYAIGGEVPISIPSGKNAQESIAIAKEVQAAALAPANPSPQDFKVAASAAMMEARARQELALEKAHADKSSNMNLADLYDNTMVATKTVGDGLDIHA